METEDDADTKVPEEVTLLVSLLHASTSMCSCLRGHIQAMALLSSCALHEAGHQRIATACCS